MSICIAKMTSIPIYFGDAFTTNGNAPFTGNPGAVCILEYDDDISDETKQKIANEVNLSAAAFISLDWTKPKICEGEEDGLNQEEINHYDSSNKTPSDNDDTIIKRKIRWFTPSREIPLCGHDTIIAAKLLGEILLQGENASLQEKTEIDIEFDSLVRGVLGGKYNRETGRITLNFPLSPCLPLHMKDVTWVEEFVDAIRSPKFTLKSILDIQYSPSAYIFLIRLADSVELSDLRSFSPDFGKLKSIQIFPGMIGAIVTAKGEGNRDEMERKPHFYSRYFAPWAGVNEDPACGSAHTVLAPYWFNELGKGFGETLLGEHLSSRGGLIYCTMLDSERVALGGDANILIRGKLILPG